MCIGGGGGGAMPLFTPTIFEPVAPPAPPEQITLMGDPRFNMSNMVQNAPLTRASKRRRGAMDLGRAMGGKRMMTIPRYSG